MIIWHCDVQNCLCDVLSLIPPDFYYFLFISPFLQMYFPFMHHKWWSRIDVLVYCAINGHWTTSFNYYFSSKKKLHSIIIFPFDGKFIQLNYNLTLLKMLIFLLWISTLLHSHNLSGQPIRSENISVYIAWKQGWHWWWE